MFIHYFSRHTLQIDSFILNIYTYIDATRLDSFLSSMHVGVPKDARGWPTFERLLVDVGRVKDGSCSLFD